MSNGPGSGVGVKFLSQSVDSCRLFVMLLNNFSNMAKASLHEETILWLFTDS